MTAVSKFDRDPEARELARKLFANGYTVDEVAAEFKAMGASYDPETDEGFGRGSIGRERKTWGEIMKQREEAHIAATALTSAFADCDADEISRAAIHMGNVLMLKMFNNTLKDEKIELSEQQAMFLAKASHHLAVARKAEIEATAAARKEREAAVTDITPGQGEGGVIDVRIVKAQPQDSTTPAQAASTLDLNE